MQQILKTNGLQKAYTDTGFNLGPVDLTVTAGEAVAVFGQNGSGKSTFFQLITGNLDPTAGEVLFAGKKMTPERYDLKRQIGYLPQNLELPDYVTGREILSYGAKLHELDNPQDTVAATMAFWDCASYSHKPLAALSHGMQKRVGLALATLHKPQFLVLDEPFSGLDIMHMQALNQIIAERRSSGLATILSTHVVPYAARLCDRALLMQQGLLQGVASWEDADFLSRVEAVESHFRSIGENPC